MRLYTDEVMTGALALYPALGYRRPSFTAAAAPELAEALYRRFCARLEDAGLAVATDRFGARMAVRLINDGPVTIWLDSATLPRG